MERKWRLQFRVRAKGFPKLGVPFWIPIIGIRVFLGLYWGAPILGNYQISQEKALNPQTIRDEGSGFKVQGSRFKGFRFYHDRKLFRRSTSALGFQRGA